MLVLSRKKNERIVLTGGIEVTVVDIRGDKVRIGIEAPKRISVMRDEILSIEERENLMNPAAEMLGQTEA